MIYAAIARFYDLTHDALVEDVALILSLAAQVGGPALELGCGTGRILVPLAQAGHQVVGLDHSAAMLARARVRLTREPQVVQARVSLVEGDMAHLPVSERYRLVIIPYNTFLHVEPALRQRVLQGVADVLAEGGRLFIDLANPFELLDMPADAGFVEEAELVDPETGEMVTQWSRVAVAADAQEVAITWRYQAGEQVVGESTAVYHVPYPHQMEMALQQAGLRLGAMWGDYGQRPFDAGSDRLLLWAALA